MNIDFGLNTVVGYGLLFLAAWMVLTIPVRTRRLQARLDQYRVQLEAQLVHCVGIYSAAPQRVATQSTLLHREELIQYADRAVYGITWRVISLDPAGGYWLHTLYSTGEAAIHQPISELRTRRALFNKRTAYKNAFDEMPDTKKLTLRFKDISADESGTQ